MENDKITKSLKTIGGKRALLPILLPIIRGVIREFEITGFLDVFGGGNKIIPNLSVHVPFLLYNDKDVGFSNVMKCTTDWNSTIEMIKTAYYLRNSIRNKEEFNIVRDIRRSIRTPTITSAALTLLVQEYSRTADRVTFFGPNIKRGIKYNSIERYKELYPVMKDVIITCEDYRVIIDQYKDNRNFLYYLDVPYWDSDIYEDSFPRAEHYILADYLVAANSKIILSNIDNPAYERLESNGWYKYCLGEINKSSAGKRGAKQTEWIWSNFAIPSHLLPKHAKAYRMKV